MHERVSQSDYLLGDAVVNVDKDIVAVYKARAAHWVREVVNWTRVTVDAYCNVDVEVVNNGVPIEHQQVVLPIIEVDAAVNDTKRILHNVFCFDVISFQLVSEHFFLRIGVELVNDWLLVIHIHHTD